MAFLLFQAQTMAFGSPGYGDALSAVHAVNENIPSFFNLALTGEPKNKLIEQAMLLAKNWHEAQSDPKSKERMDYVMMQLKISGSDGAEKFNLLSRMMTASYGVDLGTSNALASAIFSPVIKQQPQTIPRA